MMDAGGKKNQPGDAGMVWCVWPVVHMFIRRQYKDMKFVWGN